MPRPGGEADKLGNQYEAIWTVDKALDVHIGTLTAITVEAFGPEADGVEFHVELTDRRLQFHSLKRQKQGGDWSLADLCYPNPNTGRSILGDLFAKLENFPNAELRFVSATGANILRELTERAETPPTLAEFDISLRSSAQLLAEHQKRILPLFHHDEERAFGALKSLEVVLLSQRELTRRVEHKIEGLFYRLDGTPIDPLAVRAVFAEFLGRNLGARINTDQLRAFASAQGLGSKDWAKDPTVTEIVERINRRYLAVTEAELINKRQIIRNESTVLLDVVSGATLNGALLVAPGGYGKSCVVAQFVFSLTAKKIPHIAIRLDTVEPCASARQLGLQLDLPASPAVVLAGLAGGGTSVLVVDQLDAVSLVSGRNPVLWQVFDELREEAKSYPNMKLVVACRDFDLKHDYRLRPLGDLASGFKTVPLGKLTKPEIQHSIDAAGYGSLSLSEKQFTILSIPFHLLLFLQGHPSASFTSVAELYEIYWNRKLQNLRSRLGREPHWNEVIDGLTSKMSRSQVLFAPATTVDKWKSDAEAMVSEHVLVEKDKQLRFFHESFFDYAFARSYCAGGLGLLQLLQSDEQHLFRRGQVRQILAYRREAEFDRYLVDLEQVLKSSLVRFHIKRVVATGLHQITEPTEQEWRIIEPHLLAGDLARFISSAIWRHPGWFDVLDRLGVFRQWLSSDQELLINAAIWFLEPVELHKLKSGRIAELIRDFVHRPQWRERILRIMSWGKAYHSPAMAEMYLELVRAGAYDDFESPVKGDSDFWSQLHEAGEEAPRFIVDVLAAWFEHTSTIFDDGESWNFLDKCRHDQSHVGANLIGEAAEAEPVYFAERMLPIVTNTILKTERSNSGLMANRMWPWLTNAGDPFTIHDAVLLHLRKALQAIAKSEPERLRKLTAPLLRFTHSTFAYLLLRSWAENPTSFADECASYLIANRSRLDVGYSSWLGDQEGSGTCAISRVAIQSISGHCLADHFLGLETAIIGYDDEYERTVPQLRGRTELLLLRSLDRSRLSERASLRIEELERKFPELSDAIVEEDDTSLANCVGSPIPTEATAKMTDPQWISAMRKYDGSTDRFRGGPTELSRVLTIFARKDRSRFAALALVMPADLEPVYFEAILNGLSGSYQSLPKDEKEADDREIHKFPTEAFLSVIERLHGLAGRPCGSAIVECVRRLAARQLPPPLYEIVSYYATRDPDPKEDLWQQSAGGNKYYGGDPYAYGINCVRGQAAEAIAALLIEDKTRVTALRPALQSLVQDATIAVRTCAIDACLGLLNSNRDEAVGFFLQACRDSPASWATAPFNRFVHYAIQTHYAQLRDLLQMAVGSDLENAIENSATQIVLADLGQINVGDDADRLRKGTELQRRVAVEVYARNLGHPAVGDRCAKLLEGFFDDDAQSVRQAVSRGFFGLSGERLLQLEQLIARYITSRAFENETDALLHALEKSNVKLPTIVCQAAERILGFLGDAATNVSRGGGLAAHHLSTLVVRQYEQADDAPTRTQALDIIDRMERAGYFGIAEELEKIER